MSIIQRMSEAFAEIVKELLALHAETLFRLLSSEEHGNVVAKLLFAAFP